MNKIYSRGLVPVERKHEEEPPPSVDYEQAAAYRRNRQREDWRFKHGSGNLMNTTKGYVRILDKNGNVLKSRYFPTRFERNRFIKSWMKQFPNKYEISVIFK